MTTRPGSFLDLTLDSCRWPIESGSATFFCGDTTVARCSYCAKHRAFAYTSRSE